MAQPKLTAVPAETRELFCFFDQSRQIYTRVMASAPVFKCGGPCGKTREIHELGQVSAIAARTAQLAAPAPRPAAAFVAALRSASKTNLDETKRAAAARLESRIQRRQRQKEKTIMPEKKSAVAETLTPFQIAVKEAVAKAVAPLEDRIRELESRQQPEALSMEGVLRELEQQLGLPLQHVKQPASAPAASKSGAVVHDHKKRCFPSCSGYGK